jgi:hypothetical protein
MLMQDSLTGYLHEVPDFAEAEPYGEVAYDGFGNPVGYFGRRGISRAAVSAAQPMPPPQIPQIAPAEGQMPGEERGEVVYDGFGNPIGGIFDWLNPFKAIPKAIRGVGSLVTSPFRLFQQGRGGMPLPLIGMLPALFSRLAAQRRLLSWYRTRGQPVPPALMQNYQRLLTQYQGLRVRQQRWPRGWIRPQLPYTGLGPKRLYMRCAVWPGPKGLVPGYAAQMPGAAIQQAAQMAAQRAVSMSRRRRRHRR